MMRRLCSVISLKRLLVAIFAMMQTLPAGAVITADANGATLVICTADGAKEVPIAELDPADFGGALPSFPTDQEHRDEGCAACVFGCRAASSALRMVPPSIQQPYAAFRLDQRGDKNPRAIDVAALPPMPSRSPPLHA